ncbi:Uncharacterized protein DAT39_017992 [Clarias magur]|uniref:Uncharacterized protein n=1 Tax=Clarias magur TaxID=1594786 RepID=A0A8J4TKI4_CLAMG|nr:Uncharacterized protein DAT39_017992 [Clarias magur]
MGRAGAAQNPKTQSSGKNPGPPVLCFLTKPQSIFRSVHIKFIGARHRSAFPISSVRPSDIKSRLIEPRAGNPAVKKRVNLRPDDAIKCRRGAETKEKHAPVDVQAEQEELESFRHIYAALLSIPASHTRPLELM